jgi:multidrug efflux pump
MTLVYIAIVAVMGILFIRMPTAFLPDEDQGVLFVQMQLPVSATQERTISAMREVEQHFLVDQKEAVDSIFSVAGFSFGGRGQNTAMAFVRLKDWDLRKRPDLHVGAVAGKAMGALSRLRDATVFAFPPPAVSELGNATGFDLQLQDRVGLGHDKLMEARNQFLAMAAMNPDLMAVRPNGLEDTPEFKLDIDYEKAAALGLSIADINDAVSTAWGGTYVNDFVDRNRVKRVYMQADAPYRMLPEDVYRWYARNSEGEMVPFASFTSAQWTYGSPRLERYNGLPSIEILGQPAPGKSSGDAMKAIEEIAAQMPPGIGYEWTGISLEERMSGSQAPALYAISLLVVFLCLAALYESWAIPFSIMLVVPLGVVGALTAAFLRGFSNDVYFQIGLLITVGITARNAILIVEFAKNMHEEGMGLIEATMAAVRMRLRPILMTSFAFILGVLPLAISTGAGSASQNAIGTGVIGGMISATVLAIFFIPLFFFLIRKTFPGKQRDALSLKQQKLIAARESQ